MVGKDAHHILQQYRELLKIFEDKMGNELSKQWKYLRSQS